MTHPELCPAIDGSDIIGRGSTFIDGLAGYGSIGRLHRRPLRPRRSNASRMLILRYLEAHLFDPELTPTRAATACHITPRYLHLLFAAQGETVARYILRRRLEECARALDRPNHPERTITAIAFDHGFNSPTHFGRAFRARFGVTPRRYRQRLGAA